MKKSPQRMCAACRESRDKKQLLRIVRDPEGNISLDPTGKASGRGAYLCRSGECLKKAQKQRCLDRALKCNIPSEIWEQLGAAMEETNDDSL